MPVAGAVPATAPKDPALAPATAPVAAGQATTGRPVSTGASGALAKPVAAQPPAKTEKQVRADIPIRKIRPIGSRARALHLTYAAGESARPPQRSSMLNCPATLGVRPVRAEACTVVEKVKGDLDQLQPTQGTVCPMMFSPVTVTANGVWDGRRVNFERTFGNACEMRSVTGSLFDI
ncbi:SSI family serine proteinase inhibitor [Planotetraspora thailandica]|uniref:SSI family serine proteinase inhibitor n=1 Tax=Planotetraspora thailandica TaxID=487172 RepID=UPI001951BC2D|nr:SSI family serine proteinase inhibitor [Planotetraspora thailandica]